MNSNAIGPRYWGVTSQPLAFPQPRKDGPYMSRAMELTAQIEALDAELQKVKVEELDAEITDIKKRIIAFGIRPDQLYGPEDLKGHKTPRTRSRFPPKYRLENHTWSGRGDRPQWLRDALRNGHTLESLLIKP